MTVLFVATNERRVHPCPLCRGPVVQVKMSARGAYGADGKPRLTGHFWQLEPHACAPIEPLPPEAKP